MQTGKVVGVEFCSEWDEGCVYSAAKLNIDTGHVFDIESSDEGVDYQTLIAESIDAGGVTVAVEADKDNKYYVSDKKDLAVLKLFFTATV